MYYLLIIVIIIQVLHNIGIHNWYNNGNNNNLFINFVRPNTYIVITYLLLLPLSLLLPTYYLLYYCYVKLIFLSVNKELSLFYQDKSKLKICEIYYLSIWTVPIYDTISKIILKQYVHL